MPQSSVASSASVQFEVSRPRREARAVNAANEAVMGMLVDLATAELTQADWITPTQHVDSDLRIRRGGPERFVWTLWAGLPGILQREVTERLKKAAWAAAGSGAAPPAAPRLPPRVAVGRAIPRDVMQRLDWGRIFSLCTAGAPKHIRSGAVANIAGGRTEVYLDGEEGGRLMRWLAFEPNAADGGDIHAHALLDFWNSAQDATRQHLADFGVDAGDWVFGTRSIVFQPGGSPRQVPHVDNGQGAQAIVVVSSRARPPFVFVPRPGEPPGGIQRLVSMPRPELEKRMEPACVERLEPGVMVTLMGEAIHSGPETGAGEEPRIIVFFTCHPPGEAGYARQEQLNPFTLAFLARDARGTVERSLEWVSPEEKARTDQLQAAVRRACEEPGWIEEYERWRRLLQKRMHSEGALSRSTT